MTDGERAPGFYWTREKGSSCRPIVLRWECGTWQTGTLDADIEVVSERLHEPGESLVPALLSVPDLVRQLVRTVRAADLDWGCKGDGFSIRIRPLKPTTKKPKPKRAL
jgi:hypothetical protein